MNNAVREELYKALNDLLEKQFKDFKWRLKYIDHNEKRNIPTASLEKADQQEVVDLLIQYYGEDAAEVCIHVLQRSNINDVARKLAETLQKDIDAHKPPGSSGTSCYHEANESETKTTVTSCYHEASESETKTTNVDAHQLADSSEYRNYVKEKFGRIKDPNAFLEKYVSLNKRYSEVIIHDYHPSEEEREDELLATGRKHLEIIRKRVDSSTSVEKLFQRDEHGFIPQVVVLQGAAGIGKTMMAKKIMFDWASQLLYQKKFDYVFYISCSEINFHAESEKSIVEIISEEWLQSHESKNVIQNILKNEWELLFIIDGFDEVRYSFDQPENYFCTDPWKKEPMRIILRSLFKKKLLPKSSLIITTRPTALEKLDQYLQRPRYFEISGFSTKKRKEYFSKIFEDEHQAMRAFRYVKQNDTLFTMCVIPLVSWIVCRVIQHELKSGKDLQKTPCTLTAIYIRYFSSLLKYHHKESKLDIQSNVKGLCSLAAEGVWEQKTLFMEEELKKHGLHQGNSLPLFLNQNIFKRDIDYIKTYSFIHFSFQEFFAALFYVLEEGDGQHSKIRNKKLQTLLERHWSLRPDFAVGFRFLFGFLNEEKRMRELKKEFGWEISPKSKEFLLDCVKTSFKDGRHNFQLQKEIFSYLYETQDDNFVKNAIFGITAIDYQCKSDMELMILGYCIQHCETLECLFVKSSECLYQAETELFLPENKVKEEERTAWRLRGDPVWSRKATLTGYEEKQLFKRLRSRNSCQQESVMQVKVNNAFEAREWSLDKRYMEDFFRGLTKLRNLRDLGLEGWSLTESCSDYLFEVFRENRRLKVLRLSLEDTDDRAAAALYFGLLHPYCEIETLGIGEILNKSYSWHLAKVLRRNHKLRALYLSLKNPDDRTVELVCGGLKDPNCTIETLGIDGEFLNKSCSRHLADILRENQKLKALYLSVKYPMDETMKLLCEGLENPKCKLETLQISALYLEVSLGKYFARVLKGNQTLRELYLYEGCISEEKEKLLCEELKHSEHQLKELWYNQKPIIQNGKLTATASSEQRSSCLLI